MEEIFNKTNLWGRLAGMKCPPRASVRLGGCYVFLMHTLGLTSPRALLEMRRPDRSHEGCKALLETTADVLNEEAL